MDATKGKAMNIYRLTVTPLHHEREHEVGFQCPREDLTLITQRQDR